VHGSSASCHEGHAVQGNPTPLACDPFDRTCQVACSSDSDCVTAGLLSYVCDHRTVAVAFAGMSAPGGLGSQDRHEFCVNPTCY